MRPLRELRLQPRHPESVTERMACAMVNAGVLDEKKIGLLQRLGFTGRELVDHLDAASALALRLAGRSRQLPTEGARLANLAHAIGGMDAAVAGPMFTARFDAW